MEKLLNSDKPLKFKEDWALRITDRNEPWNMTYEVRSESGKPFRVFADDWHLDRMIGRDKTKIFTSSTPPSYAACELTVHDAMKENYEKVGFQGVFEILNKKFGRDWLKLIDKDNLDPVLNKELARFVTIAGLRIMQPLPYMVATGRLCTTLHIGSLRHET